VTDTGIGIAKEDIARLFQAFSQLDSGFTRKFGGTGLGLFVSRRLADLLDGRIEVASTPGRGSTFTLRIPGAV
jgi:signal transduction histidine kinase